MAHTLAIVAGLTWMVSAGVMVEISRILGPAYDQARKIHPFGRFVAWTAGLVFMVRGVSLVLPGQLIETSTISYVAPVTAVAVLCVCLALLDWIMAERHPPAWSVTVMRLVALIGRDAPVRFAAMRVPPASIGDEPPAEEPCGMRRRRLTILTVCAMGVVALGFLLIAQSPA